MTFAVNSTCEATVQAQKPATEYATGAGTEAEMLAKISKKSSDILVCLAVFHDFGVLGPILKP